MQVLKELEGDIEGRVVKWAKKNGWVTRKMNGLGYRSWPDRLFLHRFGVAAFIEFKRKGKLPTPQQGDMLVDLQKRGFNAAYFDDSDAAIAYLQALDARGVSKARRQVSH